MATIYFYRLQLISICLILWASTTYGQATDTYIPLGTTPPQLEVLYDLIDARYKQDLNFIPKKNYRDIKNVYEARKDGLKEELASGEYLFEERFNRYFNQILDRILQANPAIPAENTRLLISRDATPNAVCLGEGTIVINIGLLKSLESDGQVAFVISHELAHYAFNHVNQSVADHFEKINDKAFKKEVQNTLEEEYGMLSKLAELLKDMTYNSSRHSRELEMAADSVGLAYMTKAGYSGKDAIRCLEILDSIDTKDDTLHPLKETFHTETFPFKNRWLDEEDDGFGFGNKKYSLVEDDSIKTHPACQERIILLQKEKAQMLVERTAPWHTLPFDEIIRISRFETVENAFAKGWLSLAINRALRLQQVYPNNSYLKAVIGRSLIEIYQRQTSGSVSSASLPLPTKTQSAAYKQLLTMLHNMRNQDIALMGYYYLTEQANSHLKDEGYVFALALASKEVEDTAAAGKWKNHYRENFPNGVYKQAIQKL